MEKQNREDIRDKTFEREVLERLTKIETKLDDYKSIKDKADEAHTMAIQNKEDIKEIQDKISWLSKSIGTVIIGLVISAIVYVLKIM